MNQEFLTKLKQKVARESYSQKPVDAKLLMSLLDVANHAPSRFNLQPWHFVVVQNKNLKKLLFHVAQGQTALLEAPCTIVLVADPDAWKKPFERVLKLSVEEGALDKKRAKIYRKNIQSYFSTGPWGLRGLFKRMILPLRSMRNPTPNFVATKREIKDYVISQSMLAAGSLIVAAKASDLSLSIIQSFDETRLKKLLNIPKHMSVPLLLPIGYSLEIDNTSVREVRFPVEDKTSVDLFGNTIRKQA